MNGALSDLRLMKLREVAEETGIPLNDLEVDTRSGFAPSIPVGRGTRRVHRRMTAAQVREYLARRAQRAEDETTETTPAPADPLAEAIAATKKRQARRTGHRAANR